MDKSINRLLQLIMAGLVASFASVAPAGVYINEIFFNPPNPPLGEDSTREYIELRGTPGMSLVNHYLIFVDTPITTGLGQGSAGVVEQIFNLNNSTACPSGCSLGTNGFLSIRQKGSGYAVAVGTTSLTNSGSGAGFGAGTAGATSSIGASDRNTADGISNGEIESGFTAMLIRVNAGGVAPTLGLDLDVGNNGLDVPTGRVNWTILDRIGITEPDPGGATGGAYNARYYGIINYGTEVVDLNPNSPTFFDPAEHMEPGATYVTLGFHEAEYAARWGNSTGQTAADWHVAGLTENAGSGYQSGTWNFRQSTDEAHPAPNAVNLPPSPMPATVTSTQGVPYGTIITDTLGAPNFLLGDYNKDGIVNANDYVVWRNTVGQTGSDLADNPADGDHNYVVGSSDYAVWRAHLGQPSSFGSPGAGASFGAGTSTIPEPAAWFLAVAAALGAMPLRK